MHNRKLSKSGAKDISREKGRGFFWKRNFPGEMFLILEAPRNNLNKIFVFFFSKRIPYFFNIRNFEALLIWLTAIFIRFDKKALKKCFKNR